MSIKASFNEDIRRFALSTVSFGELHDKIAALFRVHVPRITWRDADGDVITIATDDDLREALASSPQPLRVAVHELAPADPAASLFSSISSLALGSAAPTPAAPAAAPAAAPEVVFPRSIPVTSSGPAAAMDVDDAQPARPPQCCPSRRDCCRPAAPPAATPSPAAEGPVVHEGVQCDGCGGRVVGRRYKCRVCPDYDLCQACEAQGQHPDHPMIRLCTPARWGPWGWGRGCPRGAGVRFAPYAFAGRPCGPCGPCGPSGQGCPRSGDDPAAAAAAAASAAAEGSSGSARPTPTAADVQLLREMGFELDEAALGDLLARFEGHLGSLIAHLCAE